MKAVDGEPPSDGRRESPPVSERELGWAPSRREARLTIALKDGRRLFRHITAVRGTSDNPMPRAEVVAMVRELIAPIFGEAKTRQLIETMLARPRLSAMTDSARCCAARSAAAGPGREGESEGTPRPATTGRRPAARNGVAATQRRH
ncbi:hypothetical protein [Ancylobacter sp. G4_0304]|uniref:hypothetical protein n=1 Tax=Ancylobacter sp. G4_0304 TaxID=3114289 RepID=UPI0039C6DCFE